MTRVVFVSPHLDDAVFSCGSLIAALALVARVEVVTVCAGLPDPATPPSNLDAAAGFETARQAAVTRRQEDAEALALLRAAPVWLDALDGSYAPVEVEAVGGALAPYLADADAVFGPWGIRHPDHVAVAVALEERLDYRYEELPYAVLSSEYLPHDLAAPTLELPRSSLKMAAVRCYRSQLGDGPPGEALHAAERYHAVAHPRHLDLLA